MTLGLSHHDVSNKKKQVDSPALAKCTQLDLSKYMFLTVESYSGLMMYFLALPPTVARKMAS